MFHIICVWPDGPSLLNTTPASFDACQHSIDWQRRGGFDQPMHLCKRVGPMEFQDHETGETFHALRGAYTLGAWQKFIDGWRDEQ